MMYKNLLIELKGERIELFINLKYNYWIIFLCYDYVIVGECWLCSELDNMGKWYYNVNIVMS